MRKIIGFIMAFALIGTIAFAGEDMNMPVYKGSKDLEQLKELAGVWEGTHKMGDQEEAVRVEYSVESNGSVVVEHLLPGTPHSMITMYYDKGGKLMMKHYCAMGNRPEMELISNENKKFYFVLSPDSGIKPSENHMHSLLITVIDKDHIMHDWGHYQGGKPAAESTKFALTRVK